MVSNGVYNWGNVSSIKMNRFNTNLIKIFNLLINKGKGLVSFFKNFNCSFLL